MVDVNVEATFNPAATDIDFLTTQIGAEIESVGIDGRIVHFGFFMRNDKGDIIAGCNGNIMFEVIYTDQLWVHESHRKKGYAREL